MNMAPNTVEQEADAVPSTSAATATMAAVEAPALDLADSPTHDLSADPYAEVCWTLTGFDDHLSPEWVDGYLTAVAVMSRPPTLDVFLPRMCGDAFDRAFADPTSAGQAFEALSGRLESIRAALDLDALDLDPDTLRLDPWLAAIDDAPPQPVRDGGLPAEAVWTLRPAQEWCDGFLTATQDFDQDWAPPRDKTDAVDLREMLLTLRVLTLDPAGQAFGDAIKALGHRKTPDRDALIGDALYCAQSFRVFWALNAPRGAPRRVEAAPGRNDPCPCGSGRKFKKCHGAG